MKPARKIKEGRIRGIIKKKSLKNTTFCPCCEDTFKTSLFASKRKTKKVFKEYKGATLNCPKCGSLLLIEDGKIYDFHKRLHERDSRWPIDGKGTYSAQIGPAKKEGDK